MPGYTGSPYLKKGFDQMSYIVFIATQRDCYPEEGGKGPEADSDAKEVPFSCHCNMPEPLE